MIDVARAAAERAARSLVIGRDAARASLVIAQRRGQRATRDRDARSHDGAGHGLDERHLRRRSAASRRTARRRSIRTASSRSARCPCRSRSSVSSRKRSRAAPRSRTCARPRRRAPAARAPPGTAQRRISRRRRAPGGDAPRAEAPHRHRRAQPRRSSRARVITIGRTPDNQIVVPHPQVSARHAQIIRPGGQLFLEDLGSGNGTFVRGAAHRAGPARARRERREGLHRPDAAADPDRRPAGQRRRRGPAGLVGGQAALRDRGVGPLPRGPRSRQQGPR